MNLAKVSCGISKKIKNNTRNHMSKEVGCYVISVILILQSCLYVIHGFTNEHFSNSYLIRSINNNQACANDRKPIQICERLNGELTNLIKHFSSHTEKNEPIYLFIQISQP